VNPLVSYKRQDGRTPDQLRSVSISYGVYDYAAGSVLFQMGKTKILCAVSLQNGVPPFLRGKGMGWLSAEYALLPMSTHTRTQRESALTKKDGRSVEIARFIGRCFRSIVDLSALGERTITIDCDVLQADGGTRTASISGAFLALSMAQKKWLASGLIAKPFIKDKITAVSVGMVAGTPIVDLTYEEDVKATADFNFVITQSDKIIEVQGGAEEEAVEWDMFDQMRALARKASQNLVEVHYQGRQIRQEVAEKAPETLNKPTTEKVDKLPLFSLKNRQQL
jgi:ribonuclease PH